MNAHASLVSYLKTRLDSVAIVTSLVTVVMTDEFAHLEARDHAVLAALRRANSDLQDASLTEIQAYLFNLSESQQLGLISNVKGILHEMEFVRLENSDGDSVYASWFPATNHPNTDLQLIDTATGELWEIQLKATDSQAYVQNWLDNNPDSEIAVTAELAEQMGIASSGFENAQLTTDTKILVDKLISADEADTVWDYLPAMSLLSLGLIIWELWQRYERGEIGESRFQALLVLVMGKKVVKITTLSYLLNLPLLGQLLGVVVIFHFLYGLNTALTIYRNSPALR